MNLSPATESKLKKWIKENPRTEKTLIKELHNVRWFYFLTFLIIAMICGTLIFLNYDNKKFELDHKKIIEYEEILGKGKRKTGRFKVREFYR